jgi:hypothetical protein
MDVHRYAVNDKEVFLNYLKLKESDYEARESHLDPKAWAGCDRGGRLSVSLTKSQESPHQQAEKSTVCLGLADRRSAACHLQH